MMDFKYNLTGLVKLNICMDWKLSLIDNIDLLSKVLFATSPPPLDRKAKACRNQQGPWNSQLWRLFLQAARASMIIQASSTREAEPIPTSSHLSWSIQLWFDPMAWPKIW